jgi:hypothetical protein
MAGYCFAVDTVAQNGRCFDPTCPQPASQPESVAASFEANDDARDCTAGLGRLIAPAMQQLKQRRLVRCEFLQR